MYTRLWRKNKNYGLYINIVTQVPSSHLKNCQASLNLILVFLGEKYSGHHNPLFTFWHLVLHLSITVLKCLEWTRNQWNKAMDQKKFSLRFRYGIETSIYFYFYIRYNFKIKFKHFLAVLLMQMLLECENNFFHSWAVYMIFKFFPL